MLSVFARKRPLEIAIQPPPDRLEAGIGRLDFGVVERPDPSVGLGLEARG
jgi:hypothetical protein